MYQGSRYLTRDPWYMISAYPASMIHAEATRTGEARQDDWVEALRLPASTGSSHGGPAHGSSVDLPRKRPDAAVNSQVLSHMWCELGIRRTRKTECRGRSSKCGRQAALAAFWPPNDAVSSGGRRMAG
jgi:hypothetical protein